MWQKKDRDSGKQSGKKMVTHGYMQYMFDYVNVDKHYGKKP